MRQERCVGNHQGRTCLSPSGLKLARALICESDYGNVRGNRILFKLRYRRADIGPAGIQIRENQHWPIATGSKPKLVGV